MRDVYNPFNDSQYVMGSKVIHNGIEMVVEDASWSTLQDTWVYRVKEQGDGRTVDEGEEVREDKLYPFTEHPVPQGDE